MLLAETEDAGPHTRSHKHQCRGRPCDCQKLVSARRRYARRIAIEVDVIRRSNHERRDDRTRDHQA